MQSRTLVERALPVPRGGPLHRNLWRGGEVLRICRVPLAQYKVQSAKCKVKSTSRIAQMQTAQCRGIEGREGAHQGPLGTHFGEFVKTAKVMQQQLPWTGDDLNFMIHKR